MYVYKYTHTHTHTHMYMYVYIYIYYIIYIYIYILGSFILYRRTKRDDAQDLDRGELDGLEDGVPRTNMATRAQKYRTQEPDDGL